MQVAIALGRKFPEARFVMVGDGPQRRAAERLAAEFPGTVLAPRFGSPSEAKTYIAGLDFFMGPRWRVAAESFIIAGRLARRVPATSRRFYSK